MTEDELRDVNRIPARMLVKAGSTLLVPRSAQHTHDVTEHVADNATMALAPEALPPRRLQVKVGKKGESVVALAKRHGMTAVQLAATNGVSAAAIFKPGQLVTVLQPQRKVTHTRAGRIAPAGSPQGRGPPATAPRRGARAWPVAARVPSAGASPWPGLRSVISRGRG
jgi:membrane-bound lytic murein transglycosylase D